MDKGEPVPIVEEVTVGVLADSTGMSPVGIIVIVSKKEITVMNLKN